MDSALFIYYTSFEYLRVEIDSGRIMSQTLNMNLPLLIHG